MHQRRAPLRIPAQTWEEETKCQRLLNAPRRHNRDDGGKQQEGKERRSRGHARCRSHGVLWSPTFSSGVLWFPAAFFGLPRSPAGFSVPAFIAVIVYMYIFF
ncbi:hypothetical protein Q9966_015772 [Columba livia]|nr:hypothetical protein Q9966_015772 [Columba livia]